MILVIGGAGFIGSAVVRTLVGRGERVAVATTRPRRACALFDGLGMDAVADNRALVNVLGIHPLPLREGLERYLA